MKRALICDDQDRFLEEFMRRHKDYYDITTTRDSRELLELLTGPNGVPDILILDLYFPVDSTDSGFADKVSAAEMQLAKLDQQISATKKAVLDAWTPHGIELLRSIRERWTAAELPVVIFTQKGLLLLDDAQIRAVEELDGHWLLKGRLARETEAIRLDRIMAYDAPPKGKKIFIGHGRSQQWEVLREHLNRHNLPWVEFNKDSVAGYSTNERLWEMVDQSAFAFLIMTAEDERGDGQLHARENVIHEIGVFQAKLGLRKAITLIEDGCHEFSNIHGLSQIRFRRNDISSAFEEIDAVLRREKMLPT